jgi:hypothetical protein
MRIQCGEIFCTERRLARSLQRQRNLVKTIEMSAAAHRACSRFNAIKRAQNENKCDRRRRDIQISNGMDGTLQQLLHSCLR